ncbi:ceramidase domain-containing protein [Rhodobacteraceae bacterium NNCM2]|nr:ceramidase domain-containing protein [Coraliihabitans acroporae]
MNWTRQINGYCERLSPDFWAEPVNAITNGAFILAGLYCLFAASQAGRRDPAIYYLSCLIVVIGIGSFLFHTYATAWAALADTGPILLFILSFFTIAMNRFVGLGWGRSILATLLFLVAMVGLSAVFRYTIGPFIGGSQSYFPAMLALFAVGIYLRARGHAAWKWLVAAGVVFVFSLLFRTLDQKLCTIFPMGTHFLWHILNAVVLGTLVIGLIREGREPAAR